MTMTRARASPTTCANARLDLLVMATEAAPGLARMLESVGRPTPVSYLDQQPR